LIAIRQTFLTQVAVQHFDLL